MSNNGPTNALHSDPWLEATRKLCSLHPFKFTVKHLARYGKGHPHPGLLSPTSVTLKQPLKTGWFMSRAPCGCSSGFSLTAITCTLAASALRSYFKCSTQTTRSLHAALRLRRLKQFCFKESRSRFLSYPANVQRSKPNSHSPSRSLNHFKT